MRTHHRVAVPLAAVITVLLVVDTVVILATGERTVVTDDAKGPAVARVAVGVLLVALVAACLLVVVRERDRFAAAGAVARRTRIPLTVGLGLLALGLGVLSPLEKAIGNGTVTAVSEALAGISLLLVFLPALVLGLATLRTNPFGVGARVLAAIVPAIALTALVAVVLPAVASPVLVTDLALGGIALLGVRGAVTGRS